MPIRRLTGCALALAVLTAVPLAQSGTAIAEPQVAGVTVVPLQVTGPPETRFNLVVLGDGYQAEDMSTFREQVDKHLNVLWSIEPFKSYRSYMNVYAVEIPSPDSGVDCDPDLTSPQRETPLGMGFWGGCNPGSVQRLLTVDRAAATEYADLVDGTSAANRQLLAIGNSDTYGGAGGSHATASGGNALSALITPHELGHSLGRLQDEYDYFGRGERGAPYTGGEPSSIHHTLLTEEQMATQQRKWWRWLGEESESGGTIGRYEAGMYAGSGVWRPSRHSMMKSLGWYFDQVSRERMTQRISSRAQLFQGSTPTDAPIGADRTVWLQTLHPVSHELDVTWSVDGSPVAGTENRRSLDLSALDLAPGRHQLTATVVDPTDFVRDPAVRASAALTATRTWTVDTDVSTDRETALVEFTASTSTESPVSGDQVVYAETTQPDDEMPAIEWALDGVPVDNPGNDRDLDLGALDLAGSHTLTATAGDDRLEWSVDATGPAVEHAMSEPLLTVDKPSGPEYIFNGPFTMGLEATDDTEGYVVPEFRVDGDGWYNYYGWPTDADAPFRFTAEGTEIDQLVYGKLGVPRVVPWDDVPPGYGRHGIEYRAIDATGNIGTPRRMVATLLPEPPACTRTITEPWSGPLRVTSGVTCLVGAVVSGPVTVGSGASLVATAARISGQVSATSAATVQLLRSTIGGPVSLTRLSGDITLVGSTVAGPVDLRSNATPRPASLAGNKVDGPLRCTANTPDPTDLEAPNRVSGPSTGQCAGL